MLTFMSGGHCKTNRGVLGLPTASGGRVPDLAFLTKPPLLPYLNCSGTDTKDTKHYDLMLNSFTITNYLENNVTQSSILFSNEARTTATVHNSKEQSPNCQQLPQQSKKNITTTARHLESSKAQSIGSETPGKDSTVKRSHWPLVSGDKEVKKIPLLSQTAEGVFNRSNEQRQQQEHVQEPRQTIRESSDSDTAEESFSQVRNCAEGR